jgi:NAD(P)-dependent dehydrogenase (short-subunit alcohol dehydrogenase family)
MAVALITGTSTGIGQSTALRLARDGYEVYASMRNTAAGTPLLEAKAAEDLAIQVIELDVSDAASCERAVAEITGQAGRIDVLVNNAGIGGGGAIEETSDSAWQATFDTNFFGAMRLTRLVLPGMRERREGAIVNVTSVAGRMATSPQGDYAASKFALEAASEILAQEMFRFGIRVALIEPGVILTPIFAKATLEIDETSPYLDFTQRIGRIFQSRLQDPGSPELVADVISEALSTDQPKLRYPVGDDAHSWITGRAKLSDEEWIATGREMTLDEFAADHLETFGIEI